MSIMMIRSGYAPVNGLEMYYEIHGTGEPLVLLHGGVGSIEMMRTVLDALALRRRIIAVELQAHGHTADIERPLRYELMADDVAALLSHLDVAMADVMGYSLGADTSLQVAIRHPDVVRKLVVVSTAFKREGWFPEVLSGMAQMGPEAAEMMKQSHLYAQYAKVAPRVEDWPVLVTKLGDLLRQPYDWSNSVAKIEAPVLLVFGDSDSISTEHMAEFYGLLGGGKADAGWDGSGMPKSRLAVLPATSHYNIADSSLLAPIVLQFLEA